MFYTTEGVGRGLGFSMQFGKQHEIHRIRFQKLKLLVWLLMEQKAEEGGGGEADL